ncbi:MAG TPA: AAA family ATPase, partial [Edaphobacter sp.]|nr:AAA family ATPase [Edaphobacter sp.]
YLVDGLLIRGTVSCLVSKPKVGKSTFARGLCLAVAKGEPFLGRSTWQGSCIYLALEERHAEIIADFRAMSADTTLPIEVHADAAPASAILSLVDLLRQKRPALVVIDPLFRLAHIRDEKAYAEVYAALGPLIDLARETGTHIMVTHHAGKALKADAIDSPLGSTAIAGAAATTIVLGKRESYRTIQTVTRIGPVMAETMLTFDPITRLLSVGGTRLEADRHGCEEEILDYLTASGGQRTEPEIVKNVGYKTAVNRKALRSLFQNGAVTRSGDGKKGEPFKYSIACSRPLSGTEEQECVTTPQIAANTEQMLVPGSHDGQLLVPRIITGEGEPFFDVEV